MVTDFPNNANGKSKIVRTLDKIHFKTRGHVVAVLGEFFGTMSFIFMAFAAAQTSIIASSFNANGTVNMQPSGGKLEQLLYISLSFGFSLAINVWVFFRISGGLFNPAVTLGMVLIGAITLIRGLLLFLAQMLGAIVAAFLVDGLLTGQLKISTIPNPAMSNAQAVLLEMVLTMLLVFTIFMLAAEKHAGNLLAPIGIGLALFVIHLVGAFWSGGSVNPARSFAPGCVVGFHSSQWIYWVGPMAGSILAVILFKVIKALEYETTSGTGDVEDVEAQRTGSEVQEEIVLVDSKH